MSNRKTRIWRGCTGILSSMLTVAICMSTVAFSIDGSINAALGIKSTKLVKQERKRLIRHGTRVIMVT